MSPLPVSSCLQLKPILKLTWRSYRAGKLTQHIHIILCTGQIKDQRSTRNRISIATILQATTLVLLNFNKRRLSRKTRLPRAGRLSIQMSTKPTMQLTQQLRIQFSHPPLCCDGPLPLPFKLLPPFIDLFLSPRLLFRCVLQQSRDGLQRRESIPPWKNGPRSCRGVYHSEVRSKLRTPVLGMVLASDINRPLFGEGMSRWSLRLAPIAI